MGGMYTQKRVLEDFPRAISWVHNNGVVASPHELTMMQCVPTQVTTSYRSYGEDSVTGTDEVAARIRDLNTRNWAGYSPYDTGHPFDTVKQSWDLSHRLVDLKGGGASFRGPLIIRNDAGLPYPTWFPSVPSFDAAFYGTKLFNMAVPVKPVADMANALGELRTARGIPSLPGKLFFWEDKSRSALAKAGGEYLNVTFGWKPLIADIKSIMSAVIKAEDIVNQYLNDSGKGVRRSRTLPEIHSNLAVTNTYVSVTNVFGFSPNDSQLFTGLGINGRVWQTVNHDRKIWFKGMFEYYLDEGIDPLSKMKFYAALARKVVGARLSPEVLWELSPWSWLADWFFNLGAILENIESFQTDGLVAKYGYLMCTDVVTQDKSTVLTGSGSSLGEISTRTQVVRKQRIQATPYGFGLDPATWSPERWAILAALGLTKAPKSLR